MIPILNPYTKAILGALIAFLGSLAAGWDDSHLTTTEITTAIGLAVAALAAVWAAHPTIKWLVGGLLAGISTLAVALEDDRFSLQEVVTVALAVLVALYAVYATRNTQAEVPATYPAPPKYDGK